MNIVEQILQQCEKMGSEPALSLGGVGSDTVSYSRLQTYLDGVCGVLHRAGVKPGFLCGLFLENNLFNIVASLALNRLGAVPVAFNSLAALGTVECGAIITDLNLPPQNCPVWRMDEAWLLDEPYRPDPRSVQGSDICRIGFTSGSTGAPKAVAVTYDKLVANIAQQDASRGLEFAHAKRRLGYIGISTVYGYLNTVRTLSEGGLFCFRDPEMAREARRIAMYGVQVLIASPGQLTLFARFGRLNPGAFAALQLVTTGGSPLPAALAARVQEFVCPKLIYSYGSSETGVVAAAPVERLDLEKGEIGFVNSGLEVSIVDPTTRLPIISGKGHLRIRGPGVIRSYYGQDPAEDPHFDGDWFCPGDIAALSPDGLLTMSGREDGVVNIGGVKSTAEAIEAMLHAGPGVAGVAVTFAPDRFGLTRVQALVVPGEKWSEAAFANYCNRSVTSNFRPVRVVMAHTIPLGPSGKIDRQAVEALMKGPMLATNTPAIETNA